jgi:hypothetical protein
MVPSGGPAEHQKAQFSGFGEPTQGEMTRCVPGLILASRLGFEIIAFDSFVFRF